MSDREKLIELIAEGFAEAQKFCDCHDCFDCKINQQPHGCMSLLIADHLISNGITVQKSSCPYCCDDGEGAHGRLKHSYDDEDGMAMSIHPSPKRKDGTRSLAWWATVHFRGECRDFYIEVCPFCGRRLVPLREEYDCSPEPPKECE